MAVEGACDREEPRGGSNLQETLRELPPIETLVPVSSEPGELAHGPIEEGDPNGADREDPSG